MPGSILGASHTLLSKPDTINTFKKISVLHVLNKSKVKQVDVIAVVFWSKCLTVNSGLQHLSL